MVSLLLVVFLLQFAIHIINNVGANAIDDLLWILFLRIPSATSNSQRTQKVLQRDYLKTRKQLHSTSSQDEFAKWAKLRRQHDKLLADLENINAELTTTRSNFIAIISKVRWLGTNGFRLFLQFWYSKVAIFWIPKGWVPGYIEWLLAFPRAPIGSVSIQIWGLACASVLLLLGDAFIALWALAVGQMEGKSRKGASPEFYTIPSGEKAKKEL